MSEKDKESLMFSIEEHINKKMNVVYAINTLFLSAMLAVFVAVAWPINEKLTDLSVESAQHVTREYVYKNYISAGHYIRLVEDGYNYTIRAIMHPDDAKFIFLEHKNLLERDLGDRYRGVSN